MKKTVFKGRINGQEFDNVQDYNAKMSQLLAEGSPIDAHADTSTINTECGLDHARNQNMLPGTVRGDMGDLPFGEFGNPNDIRNNLIDIFGNTITPQIKTMSAGDLAEYKEKVNEIYQHIVACLDENTCKIKDIKAHMNDIKERAVDLLKDLRTSQKIASEVQYNKKIGEAYAELYDHISEKIKDQMESLQCKATMQCSTCPEPKCECEAPQEDEELTLSDVANGLKKLCDEIFG